MTPIPSKRLRILCVDDEPGIRLVVAAHLQRRNHEVEVAGDGGEGWEVFSAASVPFDVVITDFEMPVVGGLALVERMREAEFAGRIVVFSSSLSPRDKDRFRELGVDAIVEKGGSVDELLAAIETPGGDGVPRSM